MVARGGNQPVITNDQSETITDLGQSPIGSDIFRSPKPTINQSLNENREKVL